ncbi:MAG: hypothetical protein JW727_01820 [Candidatus Aenigmarchaeota archaeon]|nr:hypothetical protein [Candidatus Aenigmarchaeota archaeon]
MGEAYIPGNRNPDLKLYTKVTLWAVDSILNSGQKPSEDLLREAHSCMKMTDSQGKLPYSTKRRDFMISVDPGYMNRGQRTY